MMCRLANQQSAPEIDIDVFGGNPLQLKRRLKSHRESSHLKYITAEVKEIVKNFFHGKDRKLQSR